MIYILVLDVSPAHLCPYRVSERDAENTKKIPRLGTANLSILETCSLVNKEASQIIYSRNAFILYNACSAVRFFENALHNPERRSWVKSMYLSLQPNPVERRLPGGLSVPWAPTPPESHINHRHERLFDDAHISTLCFEKRYLPQRMA